MFVFVRIQRLKSVVTIVAVAYKTKLARRANDIMSDVQLQTAIVTQPAAMCSIPFHQQLIDHIYSTLACHQHVAEKCYLLILKQAHRR